jgi:hypothetical protein
MRLLLLLLFTSSLLGCLATPQKINTAYFQPTSVEGKSCAQRCKNAQIRCENLVHKKALEQNEQEKDKCTTTTIGKKGKVEKTVDGACWLGKTFGKPELKMDTPECLYKYEHCFENCGGTIKKELSCVDGNCDKQATP